MIGLSSATVGGSTLEFNWIELGRYWRRLAEYSWATNRRRQTPEYEPVRYSYASKCVPPTVGGSSASEVWTRLKTASICAHFHVYHTCAVDLEVSDGRLCRKRRGDRVELIWCSFDCPVTVECDFVVLYSYKRGLTAVRGAVSALKYIKQTIIFQVLSHLSGHVLLE